jgi:hypothetical protein
MTLDPDAVTERERLDKRRTQAGFVFEMIPRHKSGERPRKMTPGTDIANRPA